ncbi:radical SAM family heme chaperone HemW [Capnocytophaga gingivalis]
MYSLYIHIPFCRQACHYCDFHFSTTLKRKPQMVNALCKELELRRVEASTPLQTIYFGGGTPSVLTSVELQEIFSTIHKHYRIASGAEITMEVNPDDFSTPKSELSLELLKELGINRLSIGVQSFFEEDLLLMNRVHTAEQAKDFIAQAVQYFDNITLDLIYGIPSMTLARWKENILQALSFGIPHLSAYALTVEPRTALYQFIKKGKIPPTNDGQAKEHFYLLKDLLEAKGFIHYELSNFGKEGYFSRNNTAYWEQKPYIGIGPSAHSYTGEERMWNISHNIKYIEQISQGILPQERETLSLKDRYNERIMTGLRIQKGISTEAIERDFGEFFLNYLKKEALPYIEKGLLVYHNGHIITSEKGLFLSDGIASDLFML